MQDLDNFKKEVLLMSRICHPNVISLRAARVLPPGGCTHSAFWPGHLEDASSCTAAMHARDCLGAAADYMLVMPLEGDNVAHMLHQQVSPPLLNVFWRVAVLLSPHDQA